MAANWAGIFRILRNYLDPENLPSVNQLASGKPWKALVSTVISLRTKDKVTTEASQRLLTELPDPQSLAKASVNQIKYLIYPAGFYRVKAENLKKIASVITEKYKGKVPAEKDALLALPGVGLKTANLVLSAGHGIPAICVDIHVHRISNRFGWINTKTADESEKELCRIVPQKYWIEMNMLLVNFGQKICTPASPRCSKCALSSYCSRNGVSRSR